MAANSVDLRREMPVVARHEGVWEGRFVEVTPDLTVEDEFETRVEVELGTDDHDYYQVNHYRWPDGTERTHELPGSYDDGEIVFDTGYVQGSAWEAVHDDRSVVLTWSRPDESTTYHEIITIATDGDSRARTWHWFTDGFEKRTLVEEERVG